MLDVINKYKDYAKGIFSDSFFLATKKTMAVVMEGTSAASFIILSNVAGQLFAKSLNPNDPSFVTIEHAKDMNISVDESMREFETAIGRMSAIATLSILAAKKFTKEASFVNKVGFLTFGMLSFNFLSSTQIIEQVLSSLTQTNVDSADTFGRHLPSMMGVSIDPFVCKIALSSAITCAALSIHMYQKIYSFVMNNYFNRADDI